MENEKLTKYNDNALSREITETKIEVITLEEIEAQIAQAQASLNNLQNHVLPHWQALKDKATQVGLKSANVIADQKRAQEEEVEVEKTIKHDVDELGEEEVVEE
jgi:hypothetical protein